MTTFDCGCVLTYEHNYCPVHGKPKKSSLPHTHTCTNACFDEVVKMAHIPLPSHFAGAFGKAATYVYEGKPFHALVILLNIACQYSPHSNTYTTFCQAVSDVRLLFGEKK